MMRRRSTAQHRQADQPADPAFLPAAQPGPLPVIAPPSGQHSQSWAPVIIGDPIFDFEPKPPLTVSYRPDTIFDGWSSDLFTVRLASIRGYSHRYGGIPRQDSAAAAFHPATGTIIFAVADGVSSAPQSHVGASALCDAAIEDLDWHLSSPDSDLDWAAWLAQRMADELARQAVRLLGRGDLDLVAVESLVATTLVTGTVTPGPQGAAATILQLGDSGAWLLHRGHYQPVVAQKNDPSAAVISSAVIALPRLPDRVTATRVLIPSDSVLLIGTDGFGDPLGDGDGMVGRLFAEHLGTPPPGRGLAHLLDFSRETFDDDRTLLAVWPRPAATAAPQ
jgi:hypothetical protein